MCITAATLSKVSQAWSQEVCHTGWSGQEISICSALEEGLHRGRKASEETDLRTYVETEMSSQHEEQEFDFSYMFEYSQDVQKEPETGG